MNKKFFMLVMMLLLLVYSTACSDNSNSGPETPAPDDSTDHIPEAIQEWIGYSEELFLAQARLIEDNTYILVTYGEKPTGGFSVEITDVEKIDDGLKVFVNFTKPGEDELVTEALTYPYDLAVIENKFTDIEYIATGDETYIPTLYGMDFLTPIKAGSEWIKIFQPAPGEQVSRTIDVEGIANVFEGNVQYHLTTDSGLVLAEGFTTGAMIDWGFFSFSIDLPADTIPGTDLVLQLYTHSPKDGSTQDLVELLLRLE